jgi:hypothetical protein
MIKNFNNNCQQYFKDQRDEHYIEMNNFDMAVLLIENGN